ncbi:CvpA family protein [Salinibacter altiplanensis]|uniref:CvpA family protein n=1 Tax=Salinibacter altiplanensis TaxID=1803181 RepID=UPI000C9EF54E|nr:CvpA family protein [Salinibacter altiplanensis]
MLTVLDWLILAILLGGLIRGYLVGAVRQAASLLGLVAALLFSVEFMGVVGTLIVESLGLAASVAPLAGFTVLFLGVYLLFFALARLLEQLFDTLSLSFVNRAVGGAVGGAKAALLLSLLFLVLAGLELPEEKTRDDSALYRPVAQLLPKTIEATEAWFPAAKRAADQLGRQVRSRMDTVPESSSSDNVRSGAQPGVQ